MDTEEERSLRKYLSPLNVWALSFGCAVGWGAFVMPGTTFLPIAGPWGTALGMAVGGIIIFLIGCNYFYMMKNFPDAGGTYTYAKKILGYDHGFMGSWFLILVYIAIIWANITALPLIFRNSLGNFFQFGFHYQIAGYDIFFGEALLSLAVLWIFGFICMRGGKTVAYLQTFFAVILFGGVLIGFFIATSLHGTEIFYIEPAFVPDKNAALAIFGIAVLSPWAFAGFESISNSTEEFNFSMKKSFAVIIAAVATSTLTYIFLGMISIAFLPENYSNWFEYINDLKNLSGFVALPTLYAANNLFGSFGVTIFILTVFAAVITGLTGNLIAASRLIFAMTRDNLLPKKFSKLNDLKTPKNAIFFILLISLPIPFLGRTAISWIIDVNTIGATIAYAYVSAVAFILARKNKYFPVQITGLFGSIVSIIFFLYFMIPNFWSTISAMSTESYLILICWSILGFIFFRYIFNRDKKRNFGKSTVVWMTLLFLIFFTSTLWLRQATSDTTHQVLKNLNDYYTEELLEHEVLPSEREKADSIYYLDAQLEFVGDSLTKNNLIQIFLIVIALAIMFNIYNLMTRREKEMEVQKIQAEQSNRAKSTFLSNMSHDIRTPMNAIIGYTTLIKKEKNLPEQVIEYLNKIENSNKHLLALINDILDMSRIESGKMELEISKSDLIKVMDNLRDLFSTQMVTKSIDYSVTVEKIENNFVMCDVPRLNRVLLNLVSNSFKFTPAGGKINVSLTQTGAEDEVGFYELRVKDTGIGMTPEFAAKVFEAYERDRSVNAIQGTGLGMAITKSIVELMGGTIDVKSELGKGTEFIVKINFPIAEEIHEKIDGGEEKISAEIDFTKIHLLLVEDNEVNREIASMILTEFGFTLDTAENGKIAVEKISASKPGDFDAILMDIQMPVMNGYEATKKIRALENKKLAKIPIIAMTANAFTEDIQAAKDAGMNSHIAKPLDIPKMIETLTEVLK